MRKRHISLALVIILLLLAITTGWLFFFQHTSNQKTAATKVVPVAAVTVKLSNVPVYIDSLGTVIPTRTVTVMTQVSGILDTIDFKEGQLVKKGQIIAHVDSRQLEAELLQARGTLMHDQAMLANDKLNLQRYQQLIKTRSISQQTLDSQITTVKANEGTVKADIGKVKGLEIQLSYCTIRSPIEGVIGLRLIDPGNYLTPADTKGIAVITQLEPATILYAVPEDSLERINRATERGTVPVLAYSRDKKTLLSQGTLIAVDSQIDTSTGTIKLKAEFPHSGKALFPNQFVNVRMQADTLNQVPIIPTSAIQQGAHGEFIFIINAGNKAELRNIKTGATSGDNTAIIDGSIKVGEWVVTDGADKLDNGSLVRVSD